MSHNQQQLTPRCGLMPLLALALVTCLWRHGIAGNLCCGVFLRDGILPGSPEADRDPDQPALQRRGWQHTAKYLLKL